MFEDYNLKGKSVLYIYNLRI